MLKMVRGGSSEMASFVREAERMVRAYGWENAEVHPYSYAMKVTKVIADLKDYDVCTDCTKDYLVSLANGLARILTKWEEYEAEPKVTVRVIESGKEISCRKSFASDLVEEGVCEYV